MSAAIEVVSLVPREEDHDVRSYAHGHSGASLSSNETRCRGVPGMALTRTNHTKVCLRHSFDARKLRFRFFAFVA